MQQRSRIPRELVSKFEDDICFVVSTNHSMIKEVEPITKWLAPMGYEMNHDFALKSINALLALLIDITTSRFGVYEKAKSRITIDIEIGKMSRRVKKMRKYLTAKYGNASDSSKESPVKETIKG